MHDLLKVKSQKTIFISPWWLLRISGPSYVKTFFYAAKNCYQKI